MTAGGDADIPRRKWSIACTAKAATNPIVAVGIGRCVVTASQLPDIGFSQLATTTNGSSSGDACKYRDRGVWPPPRLGRRTLQSRAASMSEQLFK